MKTGAAYARYSTDKQCSIEVQFALIEKFCADKGIVLPEHYKYEDEALTGMRKTKRKGFRDLVAAAEVGEFEVIVLYDLTRGARDVVDWFQFRKDMKRVGVEVLTVMDRLGDLDNPSNFLTELLTVGIGQHHVLSSRIKSMDKIDMMAKEGKFNGGYAPYGYIVENRQYLINEEEAEHVRLIFSMYAAGKSYVDILNALPPGLCGKRGRPLGKNSLHEMLKNERYVGRYSWNRRKQKYFGEWAGGEESERAVIIEDGMPAIIDFDTWEKVRKRMQENKKNKTNHSKRDYLLSGLIRCGHCGAAWIGVTTTNKKGYEYSFYTCGNKYRTRTCKAKNLPAVEIETVIRGLMRNSVLDGTMIEDTADAILAAGGKRNRPADEAFIKNEIAEIERKLENGKNFILNGGQGLETMHAAMCELETKKRLLEEKLKALKPKAAVTREYLIKELSRDIDALKEDPAFIKDIVRKYIVEIVVTDTHFQIFSTADLTMRMVVPEDWKVINKNTADTDVDGFACSLSTDGCGGRI
ncbi:MAG: recombinase family protein [Oscillospiraceae bacterium]